MTGCKLLTRMALFMRKCGKSEFCTTASTTAVYHRPCPATLYTLRFYLCSDCLATSSQLQLSPPLVIAFHHSHAGSVAKVAHFKGFTEGMELDAPQLAHMGSTITSISDRNTTPGAPLATGILYFCDLTGQKGSLVNTVAA